MNDIKSGLFVLRNSCPCCGECHPLQLRKGTGRALPTRVLHLIRCGAREAAPVEAGRLAANSGALLHDEGRRRIRRRHQAAVPADGDLHEGTLDQNMLKMPEHTSARSKKELNGSVRIFLTLTCRHHATSLQQSESQAHIDAGRTGNWW